ncbi:MULTISPECIES: helix-turn-helix transcriptional regulator [Actinomadura]|uniref:HTH cro/C1-type domain-containing protein n=1 Tax=Actinomadura madurae TaxID=1993 RepID=A0A1I4VYE3_9ACTN|nr:helix-turn-helix transcriptional regulator [Actinomadura madurae]MCP9954327.1 helix-turn-helix transcriptional regulator [Actinomadura madurae]MCP9971075.1 helix-turn-helix transcriptional regulator [Actinomadura madurae]MCP9983558.1 helix-turn-helix transcriptional regulator [Actinomadura madurae]URM99823.1 helix-turn-helix transcriptional regulator [Actinomadura madurae]URN01986.1 helix-turn-helix transcriptional regulator [Actinomadura madurae]
MQRRAEEVPPGASLAEKVEWLIQNLWPAEDRPPRNNVETAAAIARATGEDISSTTVWKLRTGRQENPQLKTLTALATFFGVPIGYFGFSSESDPIGDDLTLKALRRDVEHGIIRPEVLRALVDLSPEARWVVDEMILAAAEADRERHA